MKSLFPQFRALTHFPGRLCLRVSWALIRFTSLFGMGRGGTISLLRPTILGTNYFDCNKLDIQYLEYRYLVSSY